MPLISKERLIIFTRYPETGTTKTRLIPLLGAEGAAKIQRKMTEHTLSRMMGLTASNDLTIEIRYDGGNEELMKQWLGSEFEYVLQGDGDIGYRMQRAFEDAFKSGAAAVVIIGTDIPDLTAVDITKAFAVLKQKKMVLGPAKDGGYYLIGLQKNAFSPAVGDLFAGIKWGEHDVLKKTLNISKQLGLNYSLLKEMDDVDRPEDIFIWERSQVLGHGDVTPMSISVIIPAINEAHNIAEPSQQQIFDITNGNMATAVFDASGHKGALESGPAYMAHGGRFILVGLSKGELTYHHPSLHAKEMTLMCSRNATKEDFEHVISVLDQFPTDSFVTHSVPFTKMIENFDSWLKPETGVMKATVSFN